MDKNQANRVPLPIDMALPALRRALRRGHVVLSAPPGSGKTTRVPLELLHESWLSGKRIVILEPRRPAVRLAARYMADAIGERVGSTVGYQVRFEKRISEQTRIDVVTEGILTRRLQSDPELSGVGLIVFDEFHERNLQSDLGLALCIEVTRSLREDLRLLVMSATLKTAPIETLLPATLVQAQGRQYAIETRYLDPQQASSDLLVKVYSQVTRALQEQTGDILVFLPGRKEISAAMVALAEIAPDCEILPLYGDLATAAQDAVMRPQGQAPRRVILSTDLAESSVTIPRVGVVVDSGLARKPRFSPNTGLTRLETRRIARDSATQRAGRAGRTGPGACYRCWTEGEDTRLVDATPAELLHADLSPVVLELAQWGVSDRLALDWLDPPPKGAWDQAAYLLRDLGAVDSSNRVTAMGRQMAELPVHPRLAHMLVKASYVGQGDLAADLAAVASERDPLIRRSANQSTTDRDIKVRIDALLHWRVSGACQAGFDVAAIRRLDRAAAQLRRVMPRGCKSEQMYSIGALLSFAFPDRIAQRRSNSIGRFLMASGREVRLPVSDVLAASDYIVVVSLDAGSREGWAWLAASCSRDEVIAVHNDRLERLDHLIWDNSRNAISARHELRLNAIVLTSETIPIEDSETTRRLMVEAIRAKGLSCLNWTTKALQLRARVETLRQLDSAFAWPDLSDDKLLNELEQWLAPWLAGITSLRALRRLDIHKALAALLDWQQVRLLGVLAPEVYITPAGSQRRIAYAVDKPPVLAVALQEMFGTETGPSIASGRINVVIHLLSPAGRPLQITQDLKHFWLNGYKEVRKEMRGRYTKHSWPEDPGSVKPHSGVKPKV